LNITALSPPTLLAPLICTFSSAQQYQANHLITPDSAYVSSSKP
jgi:hypothetical protein